MLPVFIPFHRSGGQIGCRTCMCLLGNSKLELLAPFPAWWRQRRVDATSTRTVNES
jgi:hypothetical protein